MRIGVGCQKGGVGKTTISICLAAALAKEGRRTLFIDADPQQSAWKWFERRKAAGLGQIENLTVTSYSKADLHERFSAAALKGTYQDAIIDSPPYPDGPLSRSIIASIDAFLIPVTASIFDIEAADTTINLVREARESGLKIKAAYLLSMVQDAEAITAETIEALASRDMPLLPVGTHRWTAYKRAPASLQTIFEYEPSGKAANEVRALLQAVQKMK